MTSPTPPALRVSGLGVTFGGEGRGRAAGQDPGSHPAPEGLPGLAGVEFVVEPGERLVLVGASGAGKTTLLRAVAGLVPIDRGRVEIGGRDVTHLPPERRGAVYLHQTPVLFPHLTVEQNVAFPLRIRSVPPAELRARVREALDAVRLGELAHRGPGALSGGQRHRVALARAVVARPSLLLLDEPLSSLDPGLRHEIRDVIVTLQAQHRPGLVLVTHDLEEAGLLGHRVGIVMGGGIAQLAPPEALFRTPATLEVARFLGYRNELPSPPGSPVDALFPGEGGRGNGPRSVVILPPGSVRVAPPAAPLPGASWVRLAGRLRALAHPGPRPLARVDVDLPGGPPVLLEGEAEPGSLSGAPDTPDALAPGAPVAVLVDRTRVLRFQPGPETHDGR
jgi:ABC-type nitrate/sulfonate/bicarbonate transport system ATPase subunit